MVEPVSVPVQGQRKRIGHVREAINSLTSDFLQAEVSTPELDARLLVLAALEITHEAYILNPDRSVGFDEARLIETMRVRRLAGEPVSRIVGMREFWGLTFFISDAVLDPRPDTETLVRTGLDILEEERLRDRELRLADLGTGSGCILLSLLSELPVAAGVGVDISADALAVAAHNAVQLGLENRTEFIPGNWCDNLLNNFDMILTNPPYIESGTIGALEPEVRLHDPRHALDGGDDGLDAYRAIAESSFDRLKPNGWILLEAGFGQAEAIISIFEDTIWRKSIVEKRIYRDLSGVNRLVAIKRQE
ncbi:MAG: peptide chain release factor N(5)-glutamine methyltransferase [Hyphomicrobiales bacterium]|nr:peptide chain release factor N(5)-glutamine methyltransferase [Hyphomicrobiales bacterium]